MENELLRKLKERVKRFQREEEKFRLPLLSSTTEKRKRPESCQVSRRPEINLSQILKIRSNQIVQTKAERLESDLKRARDQSYIKTMEMSNLLTEKQELELKIQELTNKNLQLAKEKEELCEEYEEKLRRKISSGEAGQLEKLRQENESLSCKIQKYAVEKADLLRENNDLKEELYRKIAVMSKLTLDKEQLKMETEMLTYKNLELTEEIEEICREYEEILFRERQLKKGYCSFGMYKDQMDQRPNTNTKVCKRRPVSACQTSRDVREYKTEAQDQRKPQMAAYQLSKKWLKASASKSKNLRNSGQI